MVQCGKVGKKAGSQKNARTGRKGSSNRSQNIVMERSLQFSSNQQNTQNKRCVTLYVYSRTCNQKFFLYLVFDQNNSAIVSTWAYFLMIYQDAVQKVFVADNDLNHSIRIGISQSRIF